ncbi:glycosyltransferase [Butyrivibrio fibrisolvens]|uniref:glycosyltransferase n=1 Tax=Butyrivibrio fibrisolvens TaxID=831 RepID=UPI0004181574|nr:glycosyltransferase [Butyrivibrio fibrisolvens]
MEILWLSLCVPYDKVPHGGGQNHNFYIKYFKKHLDADITLLTLYKPEEKEMIDLDMYGIRFIASEYDKNAPRVKANNYLGYILAYKYAGFLDREVYFTFLRLIKEYISLNIKPDLIITQWTQTTLLIDILKVHFPNAKYMAIEEDVAFLGFERKARYYTGLKRLYIKKCSSILKRKETEALNSCDLVVALNQKDKEALERSHVETSKIYQSCSFHGLYSGCKYEPNEWKLLFYGAMSRKENYESAIWLINNVMPRLNEQFKLYIVGSGTGDNVRKFQSDRIIVTGYVEDIRPYFENSLCLIAPLLFGAGIKIKILEALSAGLPVVTNEVGAEGIGLTDRENFLYAESVEDYVNCIKELHENMLLRKKISSSGIKHIQANFDVERKINGLLEIITKW